jgi:glycosyltransferase involved in cell wall biosynthesis
VSGVIRAGGPSVYGLGPGSNIGGELYERELVRRLPGHGVRVIIGLPADHGLEPVAGVRAAVLRRPQRFHWTWAPLVFLPWSLALIATGRIDILRAPSVRYTGPSLLLARTALRILGRGRSVPVVIHHHHFEPRWRWLEAEILRRADLVFTVSEYSRADLIAAGVDPKRITIAYNGVEGPSSNGLEPAATWPGDGLRLLYLGRLEARKRPELALNTLAALLRAGERASLVLAGEGPERDRLRAARHRRSGALPRARERRAQMGPV